MPPAITQPPLFQSILAIFIEARDANGALVTTLNAQAGVAVTFTPPAGVDPSHAVILTQDPLTGATEQLTTQDRANGNGTFTSSAATMPGAEADLRFTGARRSRPPSARSGYKATHTADVEIRAASFRNVGGIVQEVIFKVVLLIHVFGAIAGFGPVYAYAILGPLAGRAGPNGVHYLEAILAVERRLTIPFAMIQPLSGLVLIFMAGLAQDFLQHYWLWSGIILYALAFYLAIFQQTPAIERMIAIAKAGPPTPEFMGLARRTQRVGPITTVLLTVIIILMVAKPGP